MTSLSVTPRQTLDHRTSLSGAAVPLVLSLISPASGPVAQKLEHCIRDLSAHYSLPASRLCESPSDSFRKHALRWRQDTEFLSSTTAIAIHPDYQAIIGMGPLAVPFILEELRDHGGYWYWALKAITDVDPVPPAHRGVISRMRQAWLDWGRAKGHLRL